MKKNLVVEGWRGINHSYAMVNQQQLLQLTARDDVQVFHRDLPFYNPGWNPGANANGFSAADNARLDAILPWRGEQPDIVYRIAFPYRRYGADCSRVFCFGTSEFQNLDGMFYDGPENTQRYANDSVRFITPSHWSRVGFLRSGIAEENVAVVPHGVSTELFKPMTPPERAAARKNLGLPKDGFVFLSVGAMTWNKGIDKLLRAFAIVHKKRPRVLLALKDQSNLYGISAHDLVMNARNEHSADFTDAALSRIAIMSSNLTVEQLRTLYSACDAYVSPYRAEGFNLTPLEAAACGAPIVVTGGGATDDYCDPSFALKIDGEVRSDGNRHYIEPDLDSLVAAMLALVDGKARSLNRKAALNHIATHFSWKHVTNQLVEVLST